MPLAIFGPDAPFLGDGSGFTRSCSWNLITAGPGRGSNRGSDDRSPRSSASSISSSVSFVTKASRAEIRCCATAGRPAILISSTRFFSRTDSRSSRQSFMRAANFPKTPSGCIGFLSQLPAALSEKLVVRKSAVRRVAVVIRIAPAGLNAARKPCARTVPSSPPAGSAPRTSGMCASTISAESEASSIADPIILATGASSNWLRNHRIATRNIPTGKRKALNPQN